MRPGETSNYEHLDNVPNESNYDQNEILKDPNVSFRVIPEKNHKLDIRKNLSKNPFWIS